MFNRFRSLEEFLSQIINQHAFSTAEVNVKRVKLTDGSIISTTKLMRNAIVSIGDKSIEITFVVLPYLNNNYECILGMPFLTRADPIISFKNRTINWKSNESKQKTPIEANSNDSSTPLSFSDLRTLRSKLNHRLLPRNTRYRKWIRRDPMYQLAKLGFDKNNYPLNSNRAWWSILYNECQFNK